MQQYWVDHGRDMLSALLTAVERQCRRRLTTVERQRMVVSFTRDVEQNARIARRYERGDPALIQEWATRFVRRIGSTSQRAV